MANDMSLSSDLFKWLSLEDLLWDTWREIIEQREWRPQEPIIEKIVIGTWWRAFRIIDWGKDTTND